MTSPGHIGSKWQNPITNLHLLFSSPMMFHCTVSHIKMTLLLPKFGLIKNFFKNKNFCWCSTNFRHLSFVPQIKRWPSICVNSLFIQQIFIECLPCGESVIKRHWGSMMSRIVRIPALTELTVHEGEWLIKWKINHLKNILKETSQRPN